jgi:hypothetical protein
MRVWPVSRCGGGIHSVVPFLRFRVFQPPGLINGWWHQQANVSSSICHAVVGYPLVNVVHFALVARSGAAGMGAATILGMTI